MKGSQLINKVIRTVQDLSVEPVEVLNLLNEGLVEVASRVRLPALEVEADIDTVIDEYRADLPSDYQHGLFDCMDTGRNMPVRVLNNKRQLLVRYGTLANKGEVSHVCAVPGSHLLYNPIPAVVTTLRISYYRMPDELTERNSPTCLPDQFHTILHRYACSVLFDDIEDGVEGAKVNTNFHEVKYEELLLKLDRFYREGRSRPAPPVVRGEFL